jgi:hypothetical protein
MDTLHRARDGKSMTNPRLALTRQVGAAMLALGLSLSTVACSPDESGEVEQLEETESEGVEQPDESDVEEGSDAEAEQEELDEEFATTDADE